MESVLGGVFICLDPLRCSWDGYLFVQGATNVDQEAIWFAIIDPVDDLGRTRMCKTYFRKATP